MTGTRPLVALLSDFGVADHYVGAMKGAVLTVCPDATLVDVTHAIPAHDILAGALELAACVRAFPPGTVFLAVVDPGVGSSRRGIAAQAGPYRFVAPDNGLLTGVFEAEPTECVVSLLQRRFMRAHVSRTFEGRDRFAPVAGWLAQGTPLTELGPLITDPVRLPIPVAAETSGRLDGCVLRVDTFGNLVTNVTASALARLGAEHTLIVTIGTQRVTGVVGTYADVGPGDVCALVGSSDRLEIAVRGGRACDCLGVGVGGRVSVVSPATPVVR